ncbi:hypothetical protein BaRGS_00000924 [Batillaria attramentaria]|uniref:Rho-GAP domain-containing protein n=1 Tax=Batillaria attramentaria TaxID=370345 RepID=A0ABD0M7Z9_9CAEN
MRKFVSPKAGHKVLESQNKTFGVPLDELMRQNPADGSIVPTAVSKICEHLYKHGVNQEGIFRVSGSARVVEKLKTAFNATGDADLNAEPDIMAIGGLLKLFLRELPDSLIPEHLTQEFIAIETTKSNDQDYVLRLRSRLHSLPEENFGLLKYVVSFLVAVSEQQDANKMGPMALAIVFGPNIFRCGEGIAGLKDQGTINLIVSQFITKYDELFKEDDELDPPETWKIRTKKTPPPRPPPPQVSISTSTLNASDYHPVPVPRKLVSRHEGINSHDDDVDEVDGDDRSEATINSRSSGHAQQSPHFSDEESHGRASPFVLESESHSIIESPMPTARTAELVERTIYDTITERLFGNDLSSARGSPLLGRRLSDGLEELACSVRAKVEMYERRNSQSEDSRSSASDSAPKTVLRGGSAKAVGVNGAELAAGDYVRRWVKKPQGPRRRSPSARFRHSSLENLDKRELDAELTDLLEETAIVVSGGNFQTHKWSKTSSGSGSTQDAVDGSEQSGDINHNRQPKKPSMEFLNFHENQENQPHGFSGLPSPERSPLSKHKPIIPPLDLSILHEHVEASVPILASNTQSVAWDKKLKPPPEEGNGVPSPRVNKQKKRNGLANTDIPPSPPKHQDQYQKHSIDDDYSHRLKQMTKKIQAFKKKIKAFEEEFESDHGYKPSQGEKATRPEIKKAMTELSRTRKDLKRLREECERGNRSRHGSGASSSGEGVDHPRVEDTLVVIQVSLKEKRQEAGRPEDLTLMNRDQVQEEKLAIQKSLLHFEGLHGRPTAKEDKDLMRPLYDRYRAIKRMLAKPMSPRNSLELPTVPEDQMIEIPSGSAAAAALFDAVFPGAPGSKGDVLPKVRKKEPEHEADLDQAATAESNLHELSIQELHEELEHSRGEKKRLRHSLRDFEKRFHEKHGRKVQKEDRAPMQDSYMQYKQVKARLRLLEALVLKHHE